MGVNLNIVSFNRRGFRSSEDHIRLLTKQAHIFCLREHWLLKEQFNQFNGLYENIFFTAVSPMRSESWSQGRPFGSVAILWKRKLQRMVRVHRTMSERICAISLDLSEIEKSLVISVYMPYDRGCLDSSNDHLVVWKDSYKTQNTTVKLLLVTLMVILGPVEEVSLVVMLETLSKLMECSLWILNVLRKTVTLLHGSQEII